MAKRVVPSIVAVLLVACAAESGPGSGAGGDTGSGSASYAVPGSGSSDGSGRPPGYTEDYPFVSGECPRDDGTFMCGLVSNGACRDHSFDCICPPDHACVGSTCEPRACIGVWDDSSASACDACASASCCDEIEACLADPDACSDGGGEIGRFTALGVEVRSCVNFSCVAECSSICGRELQAGWFDVTACISESCCDQLDACDEAGTDLEGCVDCLVAGGGQRCDDYVTCAVDSCGSCGPECSTYCGSRDTSFDFHTDACITERCCDELDACMAADADACAECLDSGGGGICDAFFECRRSCEAPGVCSSGVTMGAARDVCLTANCCLELVACSSAGTEVVACNECIAAGGGERCDLALACAEASCPEPSSGSGGGGGSGGSGGE